MTDQAKKIRAELLIVLTTCTLRAAHLIDTNNAPMVARMLANDGDHIATLTAALRDAIQPGAPNEPGAGAPSPGPGPEA